eukprot:Blabericola_migrator_1__9551@NODE_51_length_16309_cov_78_132619_g47_i0_p4_GENE_NODE_51_length_16309_cov_78_132619_g47_i0NODE_51_length_16309_cov_78_132619_g47_i0_p4_ORF_typecomplete_len378_score60_70WD40/PF00400_32/1_5e03WD40/PF00400_32/92WD40/PF00400_32/0_0062WD40/PF00400_32/1_1e06WD40/PF00400_32/2_6e10WD40/PF00400_32/0_9WD40/PF00400_32/1_8e07ANAPC4_WD40/PF12894_7/0_72ANAPC4_WD40/PF12894_7/2_5e05ANAPC4_WD40/PF12894_7/4_1e05ANAPC4_WD40/PF12894_7/0_12ANAPC4_WD40/PF12894_7/2_8e05Ge1_WD40/PF16529_5
MSQPIAISSQQNGHLWDLKWRSESHLITCGGRYITEWLFDGSKLNKIGTFESVHSKSVRRLALIPNHHSKTLLVACGFDALISMYQLGQGEDTSDIYTCVKTLQAHDSEIKGVAVMKDSSSRLLIATCGRDKSIWIHGEYQEQSDNTGDSLTLTNSDFYCVSMLADHTQDVKSVRFHPTKKMLMSASYDKSVRVFTESEGDWRSTQVFEHHKDTVWDLAFSPDGQHCASCGADGHVYFYSLPEIKAPTIGLGAAPLTTGLMRTAIKVANQPRQPDSWMMDGYYDLSQELFEQPIYSIDWTQDSNYDLLALGCGDNSIKILIRKFGGVWTHASTIQQAHCGDVNCVQWAPTQSTHLASCGEDGELRIWDVTQYINRGD